MIAWRKMSEGGKGSRPEDERQTGSVESTIGWGVIGVSHEAGGGGPATIEGRVDVEWSIPLTTGRPGEAARLSAECIGAAKTPEIRKKDENGQEVGLWDTRVPIANNSNLGGGAEQVDRMDAIEAQK